MTDIYSCPACNERRGCNVQQYGPRKMQIWTLCCSKCGYNYVWVDQKAQNVLDAYAQAIGWAEEQNAKRARQGDAPTSYEST
jgi:transcription elongation factor Elf1